MIKSRSDRWKSSKRILTFITGDDSEKVQKVVALQKELREGAVADGQRFSVENIVSACKELIYKKSSGKPSFEAITYVLNAESLELEISSSFEIEFREDEDLDDEIQRLLAVATIEEIPVYPNTPELAQELAEYHKKMLVQGFTAPDGQGGKVHLKITKKTSLDLINDGALDNLTTSNMYLPAELEIILQSVRAEMQRRDHAGRILGSLALAISELEELLELECRNENSLQSCLTRNPIVFGTEYVRIIPKHRLGAEYEMDYALEKTTGLFDLIEIESSSLKLFNKKGNPTSDLVHAEQQVFDWLHWIARHSSYARENLPDLMHPVGFVITGRRKDLPGSMLSKLKQRNALFKGQVHIMTYDDLLDRARNINRQISGLASNA